MWILNILFYKVMKFKIYRSIYWAIMLISIIQLIIFLPSIIILLRFFFGCEGIELKDLSIKIGLTIFCFLLLGLNFLYYSPSRIRNLQHRYSNLSKWQVLQKTCVSILICLAILVFSDDILSLFIDIPKC